MIRRYEDKVSCFEEKSIFGGIYMRFRWGILVLLLMFCWPWPTAMAEPYVPDEVYQWVQSSPRATYFFNKQQMCYETDEKGIINLQVLIVPILKTYDNVQVQDILDKRRWRMQTVDGYDDLAACAEYLRFDLTAKTVKVEEMDYLDSSFSVLEAEYPDQLIEISSLANKSLDRAFYMAIIDYAADNQTQLISQTKGELSKEDKKILEKQAKEREKQAKQHQRDKK